MGVQNRVEELRLRRGLTISQLASALGMSRQTIYSIERDPDYQPNIDTLRRIASHLQVSLPELLEPERVA